MNKRDLIVDKIIQFCPVYFKHVVRERMRNNPTFNVWQVVEPLLSPDARRDLENSIRSQRVNGNRSGDVNDSFKTSQTDKKTEKDKMKDSKKDGKEAKKEKATNSGPKEKGKTTFEPNCMRCGMSGHLPRACPVFRQYHKGSCENCMLVFGKPLYHKVENCCYLEI